MSNLTPSHSVRDHVRTVLAKLKSHLKTMSTRTVRATPRWCLAGSALVVAGGMIAAAAGLSGDANAQAASSGQSDAGGPTADESRKHTQNPAAVDEVDYELLLGRLLADSGNRQFLADLEVRLRCGNSQEATDFLRQALEVGTIAALLLDRIQSPDLLAFLQTLDKPRPGASAVSGGVSAESAKASLQQPGVTVCRDPR